MEDLFKHGYVSCVAECFVIMQKPSQDHENYHADIQELLGNHDKVFKTLPIGIPLDRGL
jgi:hypothetical protein